MHGGWRALWCGGLVWGAVASAQDLSIYDDALRSGFQDFSYGGGSDFANAAPVHAGAASIAFTGNNFNAVSFAHPMQDFTTVAYPGVRFHVHGGMAGGQRLRVYLQLDDGNPNTADIVAQAELDTYIAGGAIAANEWRLVEVRFGNAPLNYAGGFDRVDLQSDVAGMQPVLYVDDVALFPPVPPGGPVIFANGFEDAGPPPAAGNGLAIENGVNAGGFLNERYTWRDSANLPRVALLAHNDGPPGPGGSRGGELRELRYEAPGGTRSVRASSAFAAGFGYAVSHPDGGMFCNGGDSSSLGHFTPGTFARVFEGRHHAILRFTQMYPRLCSTTAPATSRNVPVTIEWLIATGRDHPLWAITWDLSGVPVNALRDDARAPYGELLFDGAATEGAHSAIAGVSWGERYRFASGSNPLSYASTWDWSGLNSVPFVALHTTVVDATMGTVQTQTMSQQDAGGYFGSGRWGTTSGGGNACNAPAHPMPCDFNWPYQSVNYSLNPFAPNANTSNTRLAWGTNFGFLGQATYPVMGSADPRIGGPVGNGNPAGNPYAFEPQLAPGHPRKSYSTFVVLGLFSLDPVGAQVAQIETVQGVTLTANLGTVAMQGLAGVNRPDNAPFAPAGWNHVRAAWAVAADANRVDANFAVAAGTLRKPMLIVSGWTGGFPGSVRFNGATQAIDVDYFPSLRAAGQELWLTLNRDLAGAANRIEVMP